MSRSSWLIAILILLVGAWLRTYSIDQIPPGLYHDEAYSGLDALGIIHGAGLPIFFEGNGGREPFFIYLHAISISLFGISPFALRLPAAFVGILTLAVFFSLVRAMTASSKYSLLMALVAAGGLAVSYWHVNFSRMGWRTISLPLFACLTFYFFWRSRRTNRLRDALLTGAFLGASLYTYLSARFLPIVLALFWLLEVLGMIVARSNSARWRAWGARSALVAASAFVVFLPLAIYFANNPQAFLFRVSDVALPSQKSAVGSIWDNAQRVVTAFYQNGDPEWRHGIAHRPILDWIIGLPFVIGLVRALWHWRKPEYCFSLLWLGIMFLPTILSRDAPDTQRAIGALPALYLFIAWGVEKIVEILASPWKLAPARVGLAMFALLIFGGGWLTFYNYFVIWANDRHAYDDFQGNYADFARWVNRQSVNVFLPMELYAEPTVDLLLSSHPRSIRSASIDNAERQKILSEPGVAIISPEHSGGTQVLIRSDSIYLFDQTLPSDALKAGQLTPWVDRWGRSFVSLASVADSRFTLPSIRYQPFAADFDHRLDLIGYRMENKITPGRPFDVELYWSARKPIQEDIVLFVHLLDSGGQNIAGLTEYPANGYRMNLWQPGLVIPDQHRLDIDPSLPPGRYSIEVGFYHPASASRLSVWLGSTEQPDERVVLALLKVPAKPDSTIVPQNVLAVRFADAIQLSGYSLDRAALAQGTPIRLRLFWQALRSMDRDYTVFVHLLDEQGKIIAQTDQQPLDGGYPTSIWDVGENVQDAMSLQLPNGIASGTYRIEIGLYDSETFKRLPLTNAASPASADALVLPQTLKLGSQ